MPQIQWVTYGSILLYLPCLLKDTWNTKHFPQFTGKGLLCSNPKVLAFKVVFQSGFSRIHNKLPDSINHVHTAPPPSTIIKTCHKDPLFVYNIIFILSSPVYPWVNISPNTPSYIFKIIITFLKQRHIWYHPPILSPSWNFPNPTPPPMEPIPKLR